MTKTDCIRVEVLSCELNNDKCKLIGTERFVSVDQIMDSKKVEDVSFIFLNHQIAHFKIFYF
jgi:hypothetical protein